jgi:hypothetical protein
MSDNLGYTPGSGATVATENSGGVHHQRVLMETTVEGVPTDVSTSSPMPVVSSRSDDLLVALSRIVKLLESNATVDSAQRQRVVVDSGAITASIAASQTLGTVTTVSTVSSVTNMVANAGMDREQYINIAKQTYIQGIRSGLTFQ